MAEIRDISSTKNLSRFFDSNDSHVSPFGQNQTADRAYRRAERIAGALFLATNHLSPNEYVRVEVRQAGLKMLKAVLCLRDEIRSSDSLQGATVRESLRYLISLLRMLAISGFLSGPNTNVLIGAVDELGAFLNSAKNSPLAETFAFSRTDFLDIQQRNPIKDIRDRIYVKDNTDSKDIKTMSNMITHTVASTVRKENIVEVLRRGGELNIVDIAAHVPEYSKKMIQRDLAELTTAGKVKKIGLKRWSRYVLVEAST